MVISLTIFGCYMMVTLKIIAPLPYVLGGWFTEFGVVIGFYFDKAKKENQVKIQHYLQNENKDLGC